MHRLYKKQKLCSTVAIDTLFARGAADVQACLAFPLRAVWRSNPGRSSDAPVQFLVSVPKRRLRHAVDRVKMRRRIREAFRLAQHSYPLPPGARLDVAFVYIDSALQPFGKVQHAMARILAKIQAAAPQPPAEAKASPSGQ